MNEALTNFIIDNPGLFIIIIIAVIVIICKIINSPVYQKLGISTKKQREMDSLKSQVAKHTEEIKIVQNTLDEQSKKLDKIDQSLNKIEVNQTEQDKKARESKLAELKDRLYSAWRFYKKRAEEEGKKEWNSVEYDGFWSLFNDYEQNGGDGNVHKYVEPYMRDFNINDENLDHNHF